MARHNLKPMNEVMAELEEKGFSHDFRIVGNRLLNNKSKKSFSSGEVFLVEQYRFEGESDPGDSSILYALETITGEKGIAINTYGAEADLETNEFLLRIENRINK
ncbi:MAG: hypothetical protein KFF73_19760 [Cyclobacteriaceae bacterium]|nr:hypothetical protein [Cyclobacteriaceae bacterium]